MSIRTLHNSAPLAIIILAIIGVAVTEVSLQYSMIYWASSFVLFGLLFSFQAKVSDQPSNVVQHLLHWSGALIGRTDCFGFSISVYAQWSLGCVTGWFCCSIGACALSIY